MIIVSGCLMGLNVKYNGKNNRNEKIIEYLKDKEYKVICPETAGGLKSPRLPSEIRDGRVYSKDGRDLTSYFIKGAEEVLRTALECGADTAILKQSSPSCGYGKVYDGTFSGKKISGNGIAAQMLKEHGINVITEEDFV